MGSTLEYRSRSTKPCSWILLAVMLVPWWMLLPRVIADVVVTGAKTAASMGQQAAWSVAGLVVLAMALRGQLGLTVSRGRVVSVLIFSLLWPYFLQGFEIGPKGTDVITPSVAMVEVVLSLMALVVVALVLGEVIRLPQRSRPWIQWRSLTDKELWEEQQKRDDPGCPGSFTYEADRLHREAQERWNDQAWRDMRSRLE